MLLDSQTAVKITHDIIHDSEEFFSKWPLLIKDATDHPSGFVDFEFSDGSLMKIPCAWLITGMTGDAERAALLFRKGNYSATWRPGSTDTASGSFSGLLSDAPISARVILADSIEAIRQESGAPLEFIYAIADALSAYRLSIYTCDVRTPKFNATASVVNSSFENIGMLPEGSVNMNLASLQADAIYANTLESTGEQVTPVEKMNAWAADNGIHTDAKYTGTIPFLPFNASASPMNGFAHNLEDNPFYPDWMYANRDDCAYGPKFVWVPSIDRPNKACWRDSDGIYWYCATIPSAPWRGRSLVYPPRCAANNSANYTVPPIKADADGLLVTVKALSPNTYVCVKDSFTYINDDEWSWNPGSDITLSGPAIAQFIVKRTFRMTAGKITRLEYEFLPIGGIYTYDI